MICDILKPIRNSNTTRYDLGYFTVRENGIRGGVSLILSCLTQNLPINRALKIVLRSPSCIAYKVKHVELYLK